MKIEQIYTSCLAQAAYYIESDGEAAVFDPLRETEPYLQRAINDNAKIKYIFETHFHADFVSGHIDLAQKTGAEIVYGPTAKPGFKAVIAKDGDVFTIGKYSVKAIHTPGHTPESTCYLLTDENGVQHGIITGDTLFIGDVGRPDLAQDFEEGITQQTLAAQLYNSLRTKIMPLDDNLIVYPSHGAGSACGKNMSKETTDTLGNQKKTNYALRAGMTEDEFIKELLDGLTAPPAYFPQNVKLNAGGYKNMDDVLKSSLTPFNPADFKTLSATTKAIILDVRHENDFVKEYIPGAVFIGLNGGFAPWVGAVIKDVNQPLLLVVPEGKEEEVIIRLSRVGFDNVTGYLDGGIDAWKESGFETENIRSVSPEEFAVNFNDTVTVVDSRKPGEYDTAHIINAVNIPLDFIDSQLPHIPKKGDFYLHCAGGYRSVIMASLLKAKGYNNMINVEKGFGGIKNTTVPTTINTTVTL